MLTARVCSRCPDVHPLAGASEDAEHLGGAVAGAAEPVRHLGVELGCLADTEDQILVAEHEPHPAGEDVEPLEPVVGARVRLDWRRRDDDLPRLDAAGPGQRQHGAAVDAARLQPDARVADLRGTDEVVDRHPVGLRQRQQQLQAGRRCPFSSRDSVLFEMPVRSGPRSASGRAARARAAAVDRPCPGRPRWPSPVVLVFGVHGPFQRAFPRISNNRCRPGTARTLLT